MKQLLFVLLLLFSGTLLPASLYAEVGSSILSEAESKHILNQVQKELTRFGILNFPSLSSEQQLGVFIFRNSIVDKYISFLPGFISTETIRVIIKASGLLQKLSSSTIKSLLEELEKQTAQKAVSLGTDWLLQNKLWTSSGELQYVYTSYWGNRQEAKFQYILLLQKENDSNGNLAIEFYSPDSLEPPKESSIDRLPWELGDWLKLGKRNIDPFIVHFVSQTKKFAGSSVIDSTKTKITVEFPEKVSRLKLAKELPYPLEEQKINLLNKLTAVKKVFDALGGTGIEFFNKLGQGVGMVKDVAEQFFSFVSRIISLSGAGLIDPFQKQSQGLDAVEVQLNLVKAQLEAKENQVKLSLTKEEAQPVENLPRVSFPQVEVSQPLQPEATSKPIPKLSETKEDLSIKEKQEKLSLTKKVCEINLNPTTPTSLGSVIINEVAWMGTPASSNNEWIEIHNRLNAPVSLEGWRLQDKDAQIDITFDSLHSISPSGFFLLERTDDTTVPDVQADLIYTGALSNGGEALYLFDQSCVLRDKVIADSDWPAGDNTNKKSAERNNHNLEWYTYDGQGFGSPRQANGRDMLTDYRPLTNVSFQAGISGGSPPQESNTCQPASININLASAQELEKLHGIGPVLAQSIVEERAGEMFFSLDDLVRVSGIGEAKVNGIKEQGCAYVNLPEPEPEPEPEPQAQDITPPQVSFDILPVTQPNIYFTLSWVGDDPASDIEPSGLDKFYLQYNVTPNTDGVFLQYESDGAWQSWQQGQAGERILDAAATGLNLWGQDGVSYNFQLKAKDVAGNESAPDTVQTQLNLAKSVVINEIAWMGTSASSSDEWLELFNTTSEPVDLSGWKLQAEDGTPTIEFAGIIAANGYFLLERTDNTTISDITADQIYTGAFGNDGETLLLYGVDNNLVDIVDASDGWLVEGREFGGRNENLGTTESPNWLRVSMERVDATKAGSDPTNWANNNLITHNGRDASNSYINGTPRQENSVSKASTAVTDWRFNEFDALTLTKLGSPYSVVWVTVPSGKTLVVEPGVRVEFENNRGFLTIEGTLTAVGQQGSGITFTSDNTSNWCGLKFTSTSVNSELNYATIQDSSSGGAGCGGSQYAVFVDGSDITLRNSTISGGNSYRKLHLKNSNALVDGLTISGSTKMISDSAAIYIEGTSAPTIQNSTISDSSIGIYSNGILSTPTIQNNTFTGDTYAIKLSSSGAALSGNTATDNTYNGTLVEGAVFADTTWKADTMPYILNKFTVNEGKKLTIEAGAQVQFIETPYSGPELLVNGTLLVQGATDNLVAFTRGPSTLYWKRIRFAPTSTGSILQYAQLSYGGGALGTIGTLYIEGSVDLQNVTIQNSPYVGIYASGTVSGSGITLKDNAYAFNLNLAICPTLTNVVISGSGADFYPGSLECSFSP